MNDPLITRFTNACGAAGPLNLRVDLVAGATLAEGSVHQSFILVGRDDACEVTLSDPDVNLRHAWLQVLGGRVFAVDLGSRTGLVWPDGKRGSGWLDIGTPLRIGPFALRLRNLSADHPSDFPVGYNPLVPDPTLRGRTPLRLEFRNGRCGKDHWIVNRLITLVGHSPDCKIRLTADDIAPYHCGLVVTRDGLWVVDLSGHGVVVNGERMRVSPLPPGAELWVGRFLIGCQGVNTAERVRHAVRKSSSAYQPPEDEVEFGTENTLDASGLSASHIMADMFPLAAGSGASGELSHPIHISGSGPPPAALSATTATTTNLLDNSNVPGSPLLSVGSGETSIVPLLCQLADVHMRMADEYHRAQKLLGQLFARVRREHLPVLCHELSRIHELTVQLSTIQIELTQQTLEQGNERTKQDRPVASPPSISAVTPLPPTLMGIPTPSDPPLAERLNALLHERAARWQGLISLFTGV